MGLKWSVNSSSLCSAAVSPFLWLRKGKHVTAVIDFPCLHNSSWPCPNLPFTTATHWVGRSRRAPSSSIIHSLSGRWLGPGAQAQTHCSDPAAASYKDVMCEILSVASSRPDGTGRETWLLFVSFCKTVSPPWRVSVFPPELSDHVLPRILSVACFSLSLATIHRLQLRQRPRSVHSERRNVMLTLH